MTDGAEAIFLAALPWIDRMLQKIARRHHCCLEEAQDLASAAKVYLIESDYAVLRKFKGESRLETYLHVVLERFASGYFNHLWGRWRASEAALELGALGVLVEQLLYRDSLALDEAFERVQEVPGVSWDRKRFDELVARIPPRTIRGRGGQDRERGELEAARGSEDSEVLVRDREGQQLIERVHRTFRAALEKLAIEDRMMLRLCYIDRLPMGAVARALDTKERHLRKRMEKVRPRIRRTLEAEGLTSEQLSEVLGTDLWVDSGALTTIEPPGMDSNQRHGSRVVSEGPWHRENRWNQRL